MSLSVGRQVSPYAAKTQRAADALVYATTVNDHQKCNLLQVTHVWYICFQHECSQVSEGGGGRKASAGAKEVSDSTTAILQLM